MQSLIQFFSYMNDIDFPYVVLRNFEELPRFTKGHDDLDLLVQDLDHFKEIFPMAHEEYPYPRVRYKMVIGEDNVYLDVRHIGDGYYPEELERTILKTRVWSDKGFFTPDALHFRLGLAFHVVHHKGRNDYQRWIGNATVDDLLQVLKQSTIGWSKPTDPTVGTFNQYWKGATSVISRIDGEVVKRQTSYKQYNLLENEARILKGLNSLHFPKVLSHNKEEIRIEDCGEELTEKNLPKDWREQLIEILSDLKKHGVQHRDIKPDNLMVKKGVIKLIDFGWARLFSDDDNHAPDCLGYPYKPSYGFDDVFSMKKVAKQIKYKEKDI